MCKRQQLIEEYFAPRGKRVAAIDIGVHNMALAILEVQEGKITDICTMENTDITVFPCMAVQQHSDSKQRRNPCPLHHSKTMADWIAHYIEQFRSQLESSDVILIERQPPAGFKCAEQLIFSEFRNNAVLVAPNSLHKHYHTAAMCYETRKAAMVKIAQHKFSRFEKVVNWDPLCRLHDMADALLIASYYIDALNLQQNQTKTKKAKRQITTQTIACDRHFEQFRFIKESIHL